MERGERSFGLQNVKDLCTEATYNIQHQLSTNNRGEREKEADVVAAQWEMLVPTGLRVRSALSPAACQLLEDVDLPSSLLLVTSIPAQQGFCSGIFLQASWTDQGLNTIP
ncbi:uncharacterized protein RBU33_010228 [Hipposideros larvatus]